LGTHIVTIELHKKVKGEIKVTLKKWGGINAS
jgi:ribosomal protein L9